MVSTFIMSFIFPLYENVFTGSFGNPLYFVSFSTNIYNALIRFSTSRHTLTWIPDTFFTSLLSGRISTLKDESGAIFIDRDPTLFATILSYLRTRDLNMALVDISALRLVLWYDKVSLLILIFCILFQHSHYSSLSNWVDQFYKTTWVTQLFWGPSDLSHYLPGLQRFFLPLCIHDAWNPPSLYFSCIASCSSGSRDGFCIPLQLMCVKVFLCQHSIVMIIIVIK